MRGKPFRYDHDKQQWISECNDPKCRKQYHSCPKGYLCHKNYWLVRPLRKKVTSTGEVYYKVKFRLSHAHFTYSVDQARHCECILDPNNPDSYDWIHESCTHLTRALNKNHVPKWLDESSE